MFEGPVYRTGKKTETGLNWTDWDQTSSLFMDQSFVVQLLVFYFEKYSRMQKDWPKSVATSYTVTCITLAGNHDYYLLFDPWFIKNS